MIPRYWPTVDLMSGLAPLAVSFDEAAIAAVARDLGVHGKPALLAVPQARSGLIGFFSQLARRDRRRKVIVSAQICPLVPRLLMRLGFVPVFIDVAQEMPSAGFDETMQGYVAAGGAGEVAAVVVAPMYGHVPAGTDALAARLSGTAIVVDMAQGVLLAERIPTLMNLADAVVYSFGIGKGLDTGGGLLALRHQLDDVRLAGKLGALPWLATLPGALALQATVGFGVYRHLLPLLEHRLEIEKEDLPAGDTCTVLPRSTFATWVRRLPTFRHEIDLARRRAASLFSRDRIAAQCRDTAIYGGSAAVHLRQILRLQDPGRRDRVVAALRQHGVDATAGGETMPAAYVETLVLSEFPHAQRFCSDAIRLPFFGRLSEASFDRVVAAVERALD